MSYLIKQVATPESGKINKGVFAIDLEGPTSSGMVSGITPPSGSVVVIGEGANNDPDFWIIKRGQDLINFGVYTLGLNGSSTEADVLGYIGSQNSFEMLDKMPLPPLTDEILHFDFSSLMSYPRTLDRTYNLGISTNPYTQLVNSPTFSTRGYMSWDGVDDYSRVNGNVEGSEEFVTVTTLVRRGNDGLNGGLFGFGNNADSTQDIYYWGGDGSRQFGFNTWNGDSWGFVASNQPGEIMDGNWHHLTAIWNRNDIFDSQIFVDGVPKDLTQVRGTTQNRTVSQQFGIAHNGWHVSDQLFRGDMQYLRQYNRILGEDEILKDYYQSNIVLNGLATYIDADHLVSYESLQGSDINDLTKTTSATLNNATHDGDAKTFLLDGTDDFIVISDPNLTNTEASIEVWFKMNDFNTSFGGRSYLVDPRGNGGTSGTSMYFLFDYVGGTYNNTVHFVSGCGNVEIQSPNLYLARDVWHHAVSTIDANANTTIYLDGKVIAQGTANPTNLAFSNTYRVGTYASATGTAYMLNGEIAQYRMYTRKITPDEVLQNYRAHAHKFEHDLGTPALPAKNAKDIIWANPDAENGIYWIKPEGYSGPAQPIYCDMGNGGWMLVAANDARESKIPGGTSRNNSNYFLNRSTPIGAPNPNGDYVIGNLIEDLEFSNVRIFGWGRGSLNGTTSWPSNLGNYITAEWPLTTTGTSRLTEIVARANVTFGGNTDPHQLCNHFILDAVQMDVSLNANSNQSTLGAAGVANASGDPSNGCYLGHGSTEGSYEGWYVLNSGAQDSQGYTTWVK